MSQIQSKGQAYWSSDHDLINGQELKEEAQAEDLESSVKPYKYPLLIAYGCGEFYSKSFCNQFY